MTRTTRLRVLLLVLGAVVVRRPVTLERVLAILTLVLLLVFLAVHFGWVQL